MPRDSLHILHGPFLETAIEFTVFSGLSCVFQLQFLLRYLAGQAHVELQGNAETRDPSRNLSLSMPRISESIMLIQECNVYNGYSSHIFGANES